MSEPTIDEMLEWLSLAKADHPLISVQHESGIAEAIRTILEQHRDDIILLSAEQAQAVDRQIELEVIRAFVERVEVKRWELIATSPKGYADALYAELAALEAEVKE